MIRLGCSDQCGNGITLNLVKCPCVVIIGHVVKYTESTQEDNLQGSVGVTLAKMDVLASSIRMATAALGKGIDELANLLSLTVEL